MAVDIARPAALLTVGHGVASADAFVDLLAAAGVAVVVDVRRHPGSRRNPQFNRERLRTSLTTAGIDYRWEERLGGRRSRAQGSPNTALRDPAMQGYADHLHTDEGRTALADLATLAATRRTAVLCSEASPARCHRRFVADHALLAWDATVEHLLHDGTTEPHRPQRLARRVGGRVVYDGGEPTLRF